MIDAKFWDDDKVKEFVRWNFERQDHNYLPAAIEQFKQEQLKSKLLLTEDGVWLDYKDTVWWVAVNQDKVFLCGDGPFDYGSLIVSPKMFPKTENYKYFSTEAAALDYILMNKPMLSVNDVVLAMQDNPTDCRKCGKRVHGTHTKMQLIELAKSKMDKK